MSDVTIDTTKLQRDLTVFYQHQMPFATSLALNRLAVAAQKEVRASLDQKFTIAPERQKFMERLVRFGKEDRATKERQHARLVIAQSKGNDTSLTSAKDRGLILGRHEDGGVRRADPDKPFFIPTDDLRTGDRQLIPRRMYPAALRLTERRDASGKMLPVLGRRTKSGGFMAQGKRSTFIIDARTTSDPRAWGIFERVGSHKRDIRMLWAFRTTIRLTPRLAFYATVDRVVAEKLEAIFDEALAFALRTAR